MPVPSRDRILAAIRALPRGVAVSYGEVARRAGLPGRARLVARVLSDHPGSDLPWHRVVRADGRIAFPPGSPSHREQCRRLQAEGVGVAAGRVRTVVRGPDLDARVWGPQD